VLGTCLDVQSLELIHLSCLGIDSNVKSEMSSL
jgi:hypothetical protein